MIADIFSSFLEMSALCIIIILPLRLFASDFRQRCTASLRCIIWLVIGFRLTLPFKIPLVLAHPQRMSVAPAGFSEQLFYRALTSVTTAEGGYSTALVFQLLAVAWLCVAAVLFAFHLLDYRRSCRALARWSAPCEGETTAVFESVKAELGLRRKIVLKSSPLTCSPVLIGLFRPCVVLPSDEYSRHELEAIFRHELSHFTRHDLWYKLFLLLAADIHWFNPIVRRMMHWAASDVEIACDDHALSHAGDLERKNYCRAILRTVLRQEHAEILLSTQLLYGGKKELDFRVSHILSAKKAAPKSHYSGALSLALLTAFMFLTGITAYTKSPEALRAPSAAVAAPTEALRAHETGAPAPDVVQPRATAEPEPILRPLITGTPSLPPAYEQNKALTINQVDYSAPAGTTILAPISGEVVFAEYLAQNGGGRQIVIESESYRVSLFHLDDIEVSKGEHISQGQKIGTAGVTGTALAPMCSIQATLPDGTPVDLSALGLY